MNNNHLGLSQGKECIRTGVKYMGRVLRWFTILTKTKYTMQHILNFDYENFDQYGNDEVIPYILLDGE